MIAPLLLGNVRRQFHHAELAIGIMSAFEQFNFV
jgi:hypothetical protein